VRVNAIAAETFEPPSGSDFWQPLVGDGAFAITRPMVLFVISTVLIATVMLLATRKLSVVPGKGQWALETVYGFVRNGVARDMIGEKNFKPYLPLLFSAFMVVLVNNLFGVIPFIQYPTMSRIAFPVSIVLFIYLLYLYIGMKRRGVLGYFKSLVPPGLPTFIIPLMFFLEVITFFFTRPVTLGLRLFGNMFAGHILLLLMAVGGEYLLLHTDFPTSVFSIGPLLGFFVLTGFELLIEFLQAYIFILLAAFYIADSLADEH